MFTHIFSFVHKNILENKHLLKVFSLSLIMRASVVLINFISGILISRGLLEANRGLFNMFLTSLIVFNTLLNFGFNSSGLYFAKKNPDKLNFIQNTSILLAILSCGFIFLFILIANNFIQIQSIGLVVIFIICYLFYSLTITYRHILLGFDENIFLLKLEFYLRIVYFILVVALYYLDEFSVIRISFIFLLECAVFSFFSFKKANIPIFPIKFDSEFLRSIFFFNLKSYIVGLLLILILRSDQYFIKYFFGNFQVGVYTISSTIIENMNMITVVILTIYLPKFLSIDDLVLSLKKAKKLLVLIFILNVTLSVIIYFFSPLIVELYFKKVNPTGVETLRILLLGFISWSLFNVVYSIYLSFRLKKSLLFIMIFSLCINLGLNYFFLPKYGITAAAWSSAIAYTVLFVLSFVDLFYLKKKNYIKKEYLANQETSIESI